MLGAADAPPGVTNVHSFVCNLYLNAAGVKPLADPSQPLPGSEVRECVHVPATRQTNHAHDVNRIRVVLEPTPTRDVPGREISCLSSGGHREDNRVSADHSTSTVGIPRRHDTNCLVTAVDMLADFLDESGNDGDAHVGLVDQSEEDEPRFGAGQEFIGAVDPNSE